MHPEMKNLRERITDLLIENGCDVTKTGIDALIELIANRDQSIIGKVINDAEKTLDRCRHDEYTGAKPEVKE